MKRLLATCGAGVCAAGWMVLPAAAAIPTPTDVGEITGLAWDPVAERLWLAGEQAAEGELLGLTGDEDTAMITFRGDIQAIQGLAIVDDAMYVGDVGDPSGERELLTVYRFADPEPGAKQYWAYDLVFPEEEAGDATALLVASNGTMWVVTSGENPGIYEALEPSRTETVELVRVADAPDGVLDAVFLDDTTVALLVSDGVSILDTTADWQQTGHMSMEHNASAIAAQDATTLWLAGPDELTDVALTLDGEDADAPAAPEASQAPETQNSTTPRNTGTIIAIGIAVLASITAAAWTLVAE